MKVEPVFLNKEEGVGMRSHIHQPADGLATRHFEAERTPGVPSQTWLGLIHQEGSRKEEEVNCRAESACELGGVNKSADVRTASGTRIPGA